MTRRPSLALLAAASLALTGCGGTPEVAPVTVTQTVPAATSAAPSATPAPTTTAPTRVESDRGNLVKKIGQLGAADASNGETAFEFTLTEVNTNPKCGNNPYVAKPEGKLIAVKITAKTTKHVTPTALGTDEVWFGSGWKAIGKDGQTAAWDPSTTEAALNCQVKPSLMRGVGPSESITGWVVLDVPDMKSVIVWQPGFMLNGGWEWQL